MIKESFLFQTPANVNLDRAFSKRQLNHTLYNLTNHAELFNVSATEHPPHCPGSKTYPFMSSLAREISF